MKKTNDSDELIDYLGNSEADDQLLDEDENTADDSFQWDTFNYSIRGSVTNTDIESIINALGDGTCMVPGFQRKFVWTKEQVAGLAFSIIKGIPVPPIYVYFDKEDGNEFVLDGQQRVTALFLYFHGLYFQNEDLRKKIDFKKVNDLISQKAQIEEALGEKQSREQRKKLTEKKKEILEILKNTYGLTVTKYFVKDYSGNAHDITFNHFQEKEKRFLKRKSIQYAVVECAAGDSPQKFYTMVFKMLNSAGKNLGPQEIRNGLFWKTALYKGLFDINEDADLPWRKIYGKTSLYSKDVELLLKMMALDYFTELEGGKVNISYPGTFSWGNIMTEYSSQASKWKNDQIEDELKRMRCFLENIVIDGDPSKCKKAALEAVYVCMNKLGLFARCKDEPKKVELSWLVELSEDADVFGSGKVLSNKNSVQTRITNTLPKVKEKYGEN